MFEWKRESPESRSMDSSKLDEQWRILKDKGTRVFLVAKDDTIVFEGYNEGWDFNKGHHTASAAKGIVGGLALMLAINDGLMDIDDPVYKYVPQWENDPIKSKITIRHLASHTSGIEDAAGELPHKELPGWMGAFWRQDVNPFLLARDEAPVIFSPGTDYLYSNPGIAMLSYAITASLKGTEYEDIRTYLWERIMKPIGVLEEEWSIGYEKTFELEGLKLVASWGGGKITPRAMATIGRLLVNKGIWEGKELISPKVVKEALKHSGMPSSQSFGFWVNSDIAGNKRWPSLPWDTVMALGAKDQLLLISPSKRLIVVRFGAGLAEAEEDLGARHVLAEAKPSQKLKNWEKYDLFIGKPLIESMKDIIPYPKSKKITDIKWAPPCTIIRMAMGEKRRDGSDNWPITWADDDNLYTAYGDGYGFEPSLPHKLGMGFAKIKGYPGDFTCENIRSDAENTGYGGSGRKASGLLMIDRVLYLWVRNDNEKGEHSRLAYSKDYARTWEWCDWNFEEFGHIAFINYGKNYEDAPDEYVYMVSHDNPSAYVVADSFVLMRAPKKLLLDRNSYEFYQGMDEKNEPVWVKDVNLRGKVFENPNSCRRSSISYNAGIGRYLWWQQFSSNGEEDTRFIGGFGLYEAPKPWGPWRTVYFTEKWDVGAGDLACFPTKWMSEDGKTVYLVFAGNDNFSLRRATLTVAEDD